MTCVIVFPMNRLLSKFLFKSVGLTINIYFFLHNPSYWKVNKNKNKLKTNSAIKYIKYWTRCFMCFVVYLIILYLS